MLTKLAVMLRVSTDANNAGSDANNAGSDAKSKH